MNNSLDRNQLQLAMVLKYHALKQTDQLNIKFEELEEIFFSLLWKDHFPASLSEAIETIFSLTVQQCVDYLMYLTNQKSYFTTIDDYRDLY